MNARTQTRTATLAAMALTLALTASLAAAAPGAAERAKTSVACRTVAPVHDERLDGPGRDGPAQRRSVDRRGTSRWPTKAWPGRRSVPQGVDWAKESVVVLALGELPDAYRMEDDRRASEPARNDGEREAGSRNGRHSPALVLAMPKSAAAA